MGSCSFGGVSMQPGAQAGSVIVPALARAHNAIIAERSDGFFNSAFHGWTGAPDSVALNDTPWEHKVPITDRCRVKPP
jgi:hypothetical protein